MQRVPFKARVLKYVVTQWQQHLAQEIIPAEQITVPDSEPEAAAIDLSNRQIELKNLVKNRIQGVFLDFGFPFARFTAIRQDIRFDVPAGKNMSISLCQAVHSRRKKVNQLTDLIGSVSHPLLPGFGTLSHTLPAFPPCNCNSVRTGSPRKR